MTLVYVSIAPSRIRPDSQLWHQSVPDSIAIPVLLSAEFTPLLGTDFGRMAPHFRKATQFPPTKPLVSGHPVA